MRTLNVAVRPVPIETPVAELDGAVKVTVGAATVLPVVNVQTLAEAKATPEVFLTPVVNVAV